MKLPDCEHEAYEVQADGSCVCCDCNEEVGGIGSAPDEYWSEVE